MRLLTQLGLGLSALILALPTRGDDEGFTPLIEGDDLSAFTLVGITPETITVKDGEIRVSGKPNGYFATKSEYRNYVLRFEWMYERPEGLGSDADFRGNSGLLVHVVGPDKVWPQSIEVQLFNRDAGNIFAIGGSKFTGKKDAEAQKRAIKPVGEWNAEEVTSRDGAISCTINGMLVAQGEGASPDKGRIAWQSEGAPIRFRKMRIKVLD